MDGYDFRFKKRRKIKRVYLRINAFTNEKNR